MKETVYIETSVISYYTSKLSRDLIIAGRQAITREKWHQILNSFEVEELASTLIKKGAIPNKNLVDALHIAITTVNGIIYLLTWNFAHINNAQMKSKILSIVEIMGYQCPIICSPEELLVH